MTEKTIGQVAFEAYNARRGGVTHDGKPTPPWEQLGDGVREGWEAAALADWIDARPEPAAAPAAPEDPGAFADWAILELMGHRTLAGRVQDVELFGVRMIRIDIPSEPPATQFYRPGAMYGLTPTTEEVCRSMARRAAERTSYYQLPAQAGHGDDDDLGGDDDGNAF